MPMHDERSLRINGGIVIWNQITSPEALDGGGQKFSLRVLLPPECPDLALLDQLAQSCLAQSKWKGQLPPGANWPMGQASAVAAAAGFGGWVSVQCITYQPPQVFDENGAQLQAMQYGPLIYTGQRVDVLVTCRDYDNVSKGVKAQLEGFCIVASANAPVINIGEGGGNAAVAFGNSAQAPAYGAPAAQAPAYGALAGQAPAYGALAGQAPAYGAQTPVPPQPGYAPNAGGAAPPNSYPAQGSVSPATTYPSSPQQAHNFLPPQ